MHTKLIRDGFIVGIGTAQIDPIATQEAIKMDFIASPQFKDLENKKKSLRSVNITARMAIKDDIFVFYGCAKRIKMSVEEMSTLMSFSPNEAEAKLNAEEISKRKTIAKNIEARKNDMSLIMKDLMDISKSLDTKRRELMTGSKAVYFEDSLYEKQITDKEAEDIIDQFKKLNDGDRLKEDMTILKKPVKPIEPVAAE